MSTYPPPSYPLSPVENVAKTHAILCGTGFLILLPLGALIARYGRNFTKHWFYAHTFFQFLFAGPIIYAGFRKGLNLTNMLQSPKFSDKHQKIGLTLVILYVIQLALGLRPPQNYLHVVLGNAILALAAYNVHYGLYTEWLLLGGLHPMSIMAKHAWLALVVVFWALYFIGLALVPHQLKQEKESREMQKEKQTAAI